MDMFVALSDPTRRAILEVLASLETLTLEALPGGRTRFTVQSVFQSVADRDGLLQSGMEEGLNDSYERLTALLEKIKEKAR